MRMKMLTLAEGGPRCPQGGPATGCHTWGPKPPCSALPPWQCPLSAHCVTPLSHWGMPAQLTPCSLASLSPSVSLSLSPLPGSPAAPQTHDALNSPWLFLLTKGRAWQGLVKISLITQKTNCYFSICQVAEDKDVKPRIRVNIRSTVTPVCLCSRQAF